MYSAHHAAGGQGNGAAAAVVSISICGGNNCRAGCKRSQYTIVIYRAYRCIACAPRIVAVTAGGAELQGECLLRQ